MLHHVSVGVADVERAAKFYDAVLQTLGYRRIMEYLPYAVAYGDDAPNFWVGLPHDQRPASPGNGTHIGFSALTRNAVDKFFHAALANGGTDNGAPGPRPDYGPDYYGAFVIDLDGNRLEATLVSAPAKPKPKKTAKKTAKKAARKAPAKKAAKKKSSKKKKAKKR